KTIQEKTAATTMKPEVTYSEAFAPIWLPASPAIRKPNSGRKTMALMMVSMARSALHHVDVFHGDRAAVAVEDDENCKTDGGLCGGNGQNEQCEDLPDNVVQEG